MRDFILPVLFASLEMILWW